MLSEERYDIILKIISEKGKATVKELMDELNVSLETVRRDLLFLSKEEKLKKVHGGAVKVENSIYEPHFNDRKVINIGVKRKIGILAAQYICDNDIIAISVGTTTLEVAKNIKGVSEIKVVTNSIPVLNILMEKRGRGDFTGEIIFLGGVVDQNYFMTAGPILMEQLKSFSFDKAFVGVSGLTKNGLMIYNINEAYSEETIVKASGKVFAVMDSSKVNKNSLYKYCDLKDVDYLITDDCQLPEEIESVLKTNGVKWIR